MLVTGGGDMTHKPEAAPLSVLAKVIKKNPMTVLL